MQVRILTATKIRAMNPIYARVYLHESCRPAQTLPCAHLRITHELWSEAYIYTFQDLSKCIYIQICIYICTHLCKYTYIQKHSGTTYTDAHKSNAHSHTYIVSRTEGGAAKSSFNENLRLHWKVWKSSEFLPHTDLQQEVSGAKAVTVAFPTADECPKHLCRELK